MQLSPYREDYGFVSDVASADAKAEDDLDQLIACRLDSISKVNNVWSLHIAYQLNLLGCIYGQKMTVDSFHTLSENEQLVNFLGYPTPVK